MLTMYARAIGAWTYAQPGLPAWLAPYAHEPGSLPRSVLLPPRAAGRASLLTRLFADVLAQVVGADATAGRELPMVFGSGHGELATTSVLLSMMNRGDRALSPARFQSSVHNAASGQLSIALRNRTCSTALAAGPSTAAACLEEAAAHLAVHGGEIVVALADEDAPEFIANQAPCQALALAVRLSAAKRAGAARLQLVPARVATLSPQPIPNPCASALPLWAALAERRDADVPLPAAWPLTIHVAAPAADDEETT